MIDRKLAAAARGNSHEPMSDSLMSPFASNSSVQSLSDIQSDEDTISIASDISNTKRYGPFVHLYVAMVVYMSV